MTDQAPPAAAGPFTGRVLLVDDNPSIRTMAGLFIRPHRWQVVEAADGEGAVREALGSPFDLVLMDLNLPGVDGLEAARRIRALSDPGLSRVPIVGMSAANHDVRRQACLEAGMNDVIDKVTLGAAIPQLLRRFAAAPVPAAPPRSPPPARAPAPADADIDFAELNHRRDLIGAEELARHFAGFAARADRQFEALNRAWRDGRFGEAADAAHGWGGGAATFQMIGVHGLLARLETALREPAIDGAEVSALLARLVGAWPQARAAFERWSAEPGSN
jgi:CheY-like chemotaxis protein/HPt (histidine-containing phosphotransfer) domain-containing protein